MTDPAIVGTIASCPKCQSMVQIDRDGIDRPAAPPQVAVGQSSIDSEAITEDAIAPADSVAMLNTAAENAIESVDNSGRQPFAGQPPVSDDDKRSIPPDQVWQSPQTARSRQIALVAALSITGLLISATVFGWFVSVWRETTGSTTAAVSEIDSSTDRTMVDESGAPSEFAALPGDSDPAATGTDESPAIDQTLFPDDGPSVVDPKSVEGSVPSTESPIENDAISTSTVPDRLIPSSPLDSDPESPTVAATSDPANGDDAAAQQSGGLQELPPELAKYTQVLLKNGSQQQPNLQAPPTIDEIELDTAASDDEFELSQTKPRELNLRGDLGIRMALASEGYPLADLLLLCGQVTTVPMEIDWVSFDLADLDTGSQVDVPTGWKTARELLDSIAKSQQSEWQEQKTLLVLTPTGERFAAVMSEIGDLKDFGTEAESAIKILTTFLNPESDRQEPQLQIGPTRGEQQVAALAIESLRRMRGMEPRISDKRIHRWAGADANLVEWPPLVAGSIGPQVDAPISIAEFFRDTARRNKVVCLVNWHDLNRRGLGPETLLLPLMESSAAKTVQRAFGRWNIQVRQVDEQHWWIGSQSTYDNLPVFVWTPKLADQRETASERIQVIMADNPDDDIRVAYDPVSDRALLKMPRYIARQLPRILARP